MSPHPQPLSQAARGVAIGIDVGATKIAGALVTETGGVLASHQVATNASDGIAIVVQHIAEMVLSLAGQADGGLAGVGIGTPGLVNAETGVSLRAVNLHWENVPLADMVRAYVPYPVRVENDVRAWALGERAFGAARGVDDFVLLTLGTGLGSAIVTGGQLVHGAHFLASELGHVVIDPNGRPCSCGLRGCAETIASGTGAAAVTRVLIEQGIPSELDQTELDGKKIVAGARNNDQAALAAMQIVGEGLGQVMAWCAVALNPARIIIGGGFGLAAFEWIVPPAQRALSKRALAPSLEHLEIVRSQVASSAVGAAALVLS